MKTQWKASKPRPRKDRIFDPYFDWALATNFAYYGRATWYPVLLELHKPNAAQFAQRVFRMQRQSWAALLRIPPIYGAPPARMQKPTRFLTALARREFLERLYRDEEPSADIKRFELGRAVDVPANMQGNAGWGTGKLKTGLKPRGVVVGVIDDGIAFAHDRFRDGPASTRIHFFWDQLVPSPATGDWDYGQEICKHDTLVMGIDNRLTTHSHASLVDEDELYRAAGFLDHTVAGHKPLARRVSHGTHVMDLASNPAAGSATAPIIAVQLPSPIVADTSGAGLAPQVVDALMYMIDRADKIAAANGLAYLPLVVNLSYGMLAGPHDGSGILEQAIDEILDSCNTNPNQPRLRVVLPAGNSHLSRGHASFSLASGAPALELPWRVLPDDRTESFLEIWYPAKDSSNGDSDLHVSVTSPGGDIVLPFGATTTYTWGPGATVVGQVDFYPASSGSSRKLIKISLAPTAWPDGALALAPAGVWRVSVTNNGSGQVKDIHAWIQRDDTAYGYPRRGRQSYFDDPNYAVFDNGGRLIEDDTHALTATSHVQRRGTLNAIATGTQTIVVAGLRRSDWKPARYSASGPVLHPPGRGAPSIDGPEAMTICDDTPSHHGLLAAGSHSGSCVAMYGTSVAAPQVAQWVASDLTTPGGKGDRDAVAKYTVRPVVPPKVYNEANQPPAAPPRPSAERGGQGRIEWPGLRRNRSERL